MDLLNQKARPGEVSDLILHALELLINKRNTTNNPNTYEGATFEISDMIGRLLVFEEMFLKKKK